MAVLVHGSAVAVGTTGVILLGPSGSGKSSMALRLIHEARQAGHFAALVSDDQVLLDRAGQHIVGTGPETIRGMIELRGSGIGRIEWIDSVILKLAVKPIQVGSENRIPEENQMVDLSGGICLPLVCIDLEAPDPFARLCALLPGFPVSGAFQV